MGPKSLLPVFNFQVPLKSLLAWACISPKANVKNVKEKSLATCLVVILRMKTLLLKMVAEMEGGLEPARGFSPAFIRRAGPP
jgi:hypothetical protein